MSCPPRPPGLPDENHSSEPSAVRNGVASSDGLLIGAARSGGGSKSFVTLAREATQMSLAPSSCLIRGEVKRELRVGGRFEVALPSWRVERQERDRRVERGGPARPVGDEQARCVAAVGVEPPRREVDCELVGREPRASLLVGRVQVIAREQHRCTERGVRIARGRRRVGGGVRAAGLRSRAVRARLDVRIIRMAIGPGVRAVDVPAARVGDARSSGSLLPASGDEGHQDT
jgi:hypothetical protein